MASLTQLSTIGLPRRRGLVPPSLAAKPITLELSGGSRVADASLAGFVAWVSSGSDPSTLDEPDVASASLPMTIAASAGATHHVIVKRRNRYGLVSGPEIVRRIAVDGMGVASTPSPQKPDTLALRAGAGGSVIVSAVYYNLDDGDDQADDFRVYAKVGSDPDPASDPVTKTVEMRRPNAQSVDVLETTITGYADGADVRVVVTTARDADGAESGATAVATVSAVDETPDAVSGAQAHYGGAATEVGS